MGKVIYGNFNEANKVSGLYEENSLSLKWQKNDDRIISNCDGYNGNKFINDEYTIDEYIIKEIKKEEVYSEMDNNKLLEKYMDTINQNIRDMEQRNIEDKREREQRIERYLRLSEERMEKKFIEAMEAIKDQNNIISETKNMINDKYDKLENIINDKYDKLENKYEDLKWWILGTAITIILTFIGILKILS